MLCVRANSRGYGHSYKRKENNDDHNKQKNLCHTTNHQKELHFYFSTENGNQANFRRWMNNNFDHSAQYRGTHTHIKKIEIVIKKQQMYAAQLFDYRLMYLVNRRIFCFLKFGFSITFDYLRNFEPRMGIFAEIWFKSICLKILIYILHLWPYFLPYHLLVKLRWWFCQIRMVIFDKIGDHNCQVRW